MGRSQFDSSLDLAFATELVGLVTLPATPTGHRPPALWQYYSVQIRRSIRSSRDEVGEVLEVVKSSENTLTILFALEVTTSADMMLIGMTSAYSGFGEFSKMGTTAVPKGQRKNTKTPPPHIKPRIYANTCPPTARSCVPASRCAWSPVHITAFA